MGRTFPVIFLVVTAFLVAVALYLAMSKPVESFDADVIRVVSSMRR